MSVGLTVNEYYIKERINNWYIDMHRGIIYGTARQYGFSYEVPIKGNVEGYIDKYIMARVNCKLYAFVPGNVREDKLQNRMLYFNYLNNRAPAVNITL